MRTRSGEAAPHDAGVDGPPEAEQGQGHEPASRAQVGELRRRLSQSHLFIEVLARALTLELPGWYLAAGCVTQTAWNALYGRDLDRGILDYDLPYFDPTDLSWAAENLSTRRAEATLRGLGVLADVKNEARVHLWYGRHFGLAIPPYPSAEAAIATFPTTASAVGVRLEPDGGWRVFAPYGLADLLQGVVRPNCRLVTAEVYRAKTARWQQEWPMLTVLPWPAGAGPR